MKLNYEKLGNHLELYDLKVKHTKKSYNLSDIKGISSISKSFVTTKANLVDVTTDNYKIVPPGYFAYNPNTARMGDKIPIAYNDSKEDILVSSIYPVFKIISNSIIPEYLMLWFKRPEFDRYSRYMSNGSAREVFDWEEMCNVSLPTPTIEKQNEIVNAYNIISNRIKLKKKINDNLAA